MTRAERIRQSRAQTRLVADELRQLAAAMLPTSSTRAHLEHVGVLLDNADHYLAKIAEALDELEVLTARGAAHDVARRGFFRRRGDP